jgi:hypothetical protein
MLINNSAWEDKLDCKEDTSWRSKLILKKSKTKANPKRNGLDKNMNPLEFHLKIHISRRILWIVPKDSSSSCTNN